MSKHGKLLSTKQRRNLPLHIMILPGMAMVFVFSYLPMFGLVMAFQNFSPRKGFFGSDYIGLANFEYAFRLPGFWQVVYNTLLISILKILFSIIIPVLVALLLNALISNLYKRTIQTIIYFPHFLSWIILAGLFIDILSPSDGAINAVLKFLGANPIYFLGDKNWFPYTMVITDIWKGFGYGTIIYLAALTSIDPGLFEAAEIDGAGRFKQVLYITLPSLMPVIMVMGMLSLGGILNAGGTVSASGSSGFEQIYNLYSPQVYETGDILETLVFRLGLGGGQYSVASAVGMVKSVFTFLLMSLGYWLAKRIANYEIL
jgi:putative aldouronate transport system permease protein